MDDFKALLVQQLEDINDAEKQWLEAVPGFTQAAHSPALRQALAAEGERARGDSGRIRSAFQLLGVNPSVRVSKGMRGLVEAARGATSAANGFSAPVADAALVAEVQKIKHYEICAYGCARHLAERIGETEIARMLDETKREEYSFDGRLTEVSSKAA